MRQMVCLLIGLLFLVISGCAATPAGNNKSMTLARSGCCSYHDGVCGCSGDQIVCCDGTLSPSCTCSGY